MSGVAQVGTILVANSIVDLFDFSQDKAEGKLHTMINLYTSFYAASLFISGIIAERYNRKIPH